MREPKTGGKYGEKESENEREKRKKKEGDKWAWARVNVVAVMAQVPGVDTKFGERSQGGG